jgi:hypothetical protein
MAAYILARNVIKFPRTFFNKRPVVSRIDVNPLIETEVPQCRLHQEMMEFPPSGRGAFIFTVSDKLDDSKFNIVRSEAKEWKTFFNSRYYKTHVTFVNTEEPILPFGITYDNYNDVKIYTDKDELDRVIDWMLERQY